MGFNWKLFKSYGLRKRLKQINCGWAGLIFAVYAFNYLWAPLIDRIQIPYLTKKLGHRRGWIVSMQIIFICSCILEFN